MSKKTFDDSTVVENSNDEVNSGMLIASVVPESKQDVFGDSVSEDSDVFLDAIGDTSHSVQFYEEEAFLVKTIIDYIRNGDSAIIVGTREHRDKLDEGLKKYKDIPAARLRGQYISLDAEETLSTFMVNGSPDPDRFFELIGSIIARAANGGRPVRVFGEMVALLWASGNPKAAIQLEELWNELQKTYTFSLFCAYPLKGFSGKTHADLFAKVCLSHSRVIPAESYGSLVTDNERLREVALLQQKAQSLESEMVKRKQLEEQKDQLLGIVSHELKTPLTSMKMFIDALNKSLISDDKKKQQYLTEKIYDQANRLSELVNELLDISRIDAGKMRYRLEHLELDRLIEDSIDGMQSVRSHRVFFTGRTRVTVRGDRYRLYQVLMNLLSNAMKYSPGNTKILVSLKKKGKNAIVSVEDFGIGIKSDQKEKIFDRLYQVNDSEDSSFLGLGLGLYISKEIIEQHNGRIWVTSRRGKGSTFFFSLPIDAEAGYTV